MTTTRDQGNTTAPRERTPETTDGTERGDGDPLDICVLSERAITRNEIIVRARVIGGLQMVDRGEADDKIISVLENDYVWGEARDLRDLPHVLIERLQHYFLTYRLVPGDRRHQHQLGRSLTGAHQPTSCRPSSRPPESRHATP